MGIGGGGKEGVKNLSPRRQKGENIYCGGAGIGWPHNPSVNAEEAQGRASNVGSFQEPIFPRWPQQVHRLGSNIGKGFVQW
jgi:hypothetical protein